jgi:hypothetical protein
LPTFTLAQRNAELDAHNAKQLARIARETGDQLPQRTVAGATAAGDERRLRGIPVQAKGVGGAINGSRPGETLAERPNAMQHSPQATSDQLGGRPVSAASLSAIQQRP